MEHATLPRFPARLLAALALAASCGMASLPPRAARAKEAPLSLAGAEQQVLLPLDIAALNRLTLARLSGTPGKLGGFLPAFDRRLDTAYEATEAGTAVLDIAFARPQLLREARLRFGEGRYEWSLAGAASLAELERGGGEVRWLIPPRVREPATLWDEATFPPAGVQAVRLAVRRAAGEEPVTLVECNLLAEQSLEALGVRSAGPAVPAGQLFPLEVIGLFSGGEQRPLAGRGIRLHIAPPTAARVSNALRIVGVRRGPFEVRATLGRLTSPPLPLEVVDAD